MDARVWLNGRLVTAADANVPFLTPTLHYGVGVFEGIRCYATRSGGAAIFRLEEHVDRLMGSAKVYRMETAFSRDQIRDACVEVVAINDLKDCYLRPLIYRGYENLGVNPFGSPVEVVVAAFPWEKYLGEDALTKGVAAKVFGAVAKHGVNVIMIAQGSSELNLAFVVNDSDCDQAVRALHDEFELARAPGKG